MYRMLRSPIFKSSLLTIGFTAIIHISNYIYTLVCVRFLNPHEYSDLALIVSFYSLTGVFAATLANTSLSLLSRNRYTENYKELKSTILHTSTVALYAVFILTLIILTPVIHLAFGVESIPEIIIILTAGIFSIGNGLLAMHFQLQKRFIINGFFGVNSALLKLLFSFILLYFGYKTLGVSIALFLSGLLSFLFFYPKKDIGSYANLVILENRHIESAKAFLKSHKRFILKNLISALAIIICTILDTLLAKKLLSPNSAAQYIGMATLAKLFFYTTTAISVVIFPYLLHKESTTPKRVIFRLFMFMLFLAGVISMFISIMFPTQIIKLILGAAYTLEANKLAYILSASIAASFASVAINLSSLLDAAHFNKNIIAVAILGIIILFLAQPSSITALSLCLSVLFAISFMVLYNNCIKKHL